MDNNSKELFRIVEKRGDGVWVPMRQVYLTLSHARNARSNMAWPKGDFSKMRIERTEASWEVVDGPA